MENKKTVKPKILIVLIVIGIVIAIFGGGFLIFKRILTKEHKGDSPTSSTISSLLLVDSDVKIDLKSTNGGREVILTISDFPNDVNSVDYELTYTTKEGLPRGVLGTIRVENNNRVLERLITLGTCSSGKCVYDENVGKVTVTLKFNSPNGASRFQKEYSI